MTLTATATSRRKAMAALGELIAVCRIATVGLEGRVQRTSAYGDPWMMRPASSSVKARRVCVRTPPGTRATVWRTFWAAAMSSGASKITTTSYWPCVT